MRVHAPLRGRISGRSARQWLLAAACSLAMAGMLVSCGGHNYVTHAGWAERQRGSSEQASSAHTRTVQTLSKRASSHGSKKRASFFQFQSSKISQERVQGRRVRPDGDKTSRRPRHARVQPTSKASRRRPRRVADQVPGARRSSVTGGKRRGPSKKRRPQGTYHVTVQEEAPSKHVVYLGYLRLQVRQRIPAVDAITAIVKKADGYIERLGSQTVVVRIPAGDFDAAMARFAELGRVLARRIQALDVSKQFTDLDARLAVAAESRTRLLALLATVADVKERLRIVQEIKRLSERIEDIESSLGTLRNLVAYYTITIDLVARDRRHRATSHRSAFPWVRGLVAHRITLRSGQPRVVLPVAKGFVRFEEAKSWHARAADTAMVRAAELDNEPHGDTAFWRAAVQHELQGRGEILLAEGKAGPVQWTAWRNRDIEPRVWLVAVRAVGDRLVVAEGFFPKQASWERHKSAVLAAFAQLGVQ